MIGGIMDQYQKNIETLRKCQLHYDNMTPEDPPDDECPECGALIEEDGDGVKCTECDWSAHPDYDYPED
jgi:tRNA(Ile2) C34 agmatinyltransferase TiaS